MFILTWIAGLVACLSPFLFWPILGLLTFFSLASISENFQTNDHPSWGWWTIWTLPSLLILEARYQVNFKTLVLGFLAYVFLGLCYSLWKWFRECRILRGNLDKAIALRVRLSAPEAMTWPATLEIPRCCLFRGYGERTFRSLPDTLKELTPDLSDHKGTVANWIFFWFFLTLRDLTIDLIDTLLETLKGLYQSIANNQFKA